MDRSLNVQGAGRIYLIDNGSTDGSCAIAEQYALATGRVELIGLPEPWQQLAHYRTAIAALDIVNTCEWLLIADLDEFWFCKSPADNLKGALSRFDRMDVIYANWFIFGSAGHIEHPGKPPDSTHAAARPARIP